MYKPLLARCRVATQNANAADLLYRIAYWMPKAKIVHRGLNWMANSAAQWCQQTGLSLDQYRRAIALLRTLGLVETEQHLFFGKAVTHVRLTDHGCAAIGKPPLDQGTAASPASGNFAHTEKGKNAQLYIQGESSLESHQGDSNTAFASAHAICLPLEQEVSGKHKSNSTPDSKKTSAVQIEEKAEEDLGSPQINSQGAGASLPPSDILAFTASPAPSSGLSITHPVSVSQPKKMQGSNPADLAARWKVLIVEHYGDYVPPFTKKEFGQLKDFAQACPPGQAVSILECCLCGWSNFTSFAIEHYSAFALPARPTLDVLMKYRTGAVNFALKEAAKHQVMLDTNAKKLTVAPAFEPIVKKPPPEYVKPTLEEVLAIMNDDTTADDNSEATKLIGPQQT